MKYSGHILNHYSLINIHYSSYATEYRHSPKDVAFQVKVNFRKRNNWIIKNKHPSLQTERSLMLTTKEHIIRQSAALFNTKGYNGCSLQDIMEATGLKKGGIYNHFKNKDEIAFESFDYSFNLVKERFQEALSNCKNSFEKIMSIISVFESFYTNPVTLGGCPIFNTAVDSSGIHPSLTEKARAAINHLKRYIEIKIDEGIESGEFKHTIKSEELSTLILISMEGALIMARVNNDPGPVQTAVKHLAQVINEKIIF